MEILKLPEAIYQYYKREVRGSENDSYDQVRRKLTRNAELSETCQTKRGDGLFHMYGKLHFIVSADGMIVWMKNNCPTPEGWKRDNSLYLKLNKELGIETSINEIGLLARDSFVKNKRRRNGMRWKVGDERIV